MTIETVPGSFRDPSGFLFYSENEIFRQINFEYKENYDELMSSGLYEHLVEKKLLLPHIEINDKFQEDSSVYKIIKPEHLTFISFPYEWCFSQLKDAALVTLEIQRIALEHEMILKDASAYNIQFRGCRPVLIDTLSFEKYNEGEPWVAYRQFCQHFLAPLALMSSVDERLNQLFRVYIDGIPLDLTSRLLPGKTKISFATATHIHLHSRTQKKYADKNVTKKPRAMKKLAMRGLIDNLNNSVKKMKRQIKSTEWGEYYQDTNYEDHSFQNKQKLVSDFLDMALNERSKIVWDLGANTGVFSRIASEKGLLAIAFDIDINAVEKNYSKTDDAVCPVLPLLLDLTNPSPAIGWENKERQSLIDRGPADAVMALALIHHLAISNNVPLDKLADFFASLSDNLIIEFVPKEDSQVKRLLLTRKDIFRDYHLSGFEKAFKKRFRIVAKESIEKTDRHLYLMSKT